MTRDEILHIANRRGKSCYDLILEVYKEIDDGLNSRTCENCRWYKDIDKSYKVCKLFDLANGKDFGCVKFEVKDK